MKMAFNCDLKWADLNGADSVKRHCGVCDKNVFNLSAMSRGEAHRFMASFEAGQKPCIRFVTRSGRIMHNGDPRPELTQLDKQQVGAGHLIAAALIAQAALFALVDDPVDFFFDPFAAIGKGFADDVPAKFERANEGEVMGVTF